MSDGFPGHATTCVTADDLSVAVAAPARPVRGRRRLLAGLAACVGAVSALCAAPRAAHAQYHHMMSTISMDAATGNVLSQANPDLQRYPASLTKLMTLYLTFKALHAGRISLDTQVPVSIHAASMEPSKLGLIPGSYFTVEQAILGLVTKSANDAASALGELQGGGSEDAFAAMMTQQAHALGMNATTFRNASGLPNAEQVTTARDLALLTRHLLIDFPDEYHYFSVPSFIFRGHMVMNHDPMLRIYPGADGLKTGFTDEAGHNLVTSAIRGNVRLIGVVLGAWSNPQRSNAMAAMLDDGFRHEGVPVEAAPPLPQAGGGMILASAHGHRRHHGAGGAVQMAARHPAGAHVVLAAAHGVRGHAGPKGASVHLAVAHHLAHPARAPHGAHHRA